MCLGAAVRPGFLSSSCQWACFISRQVEMMTNTVMNQPLNITFCMETAAVLLWMSRQQFPN